VAIPQIETTGSPQLVFNCGEKLGRGYAAGMDLWITLKTGLPTSSTPAWTTLRVAHTHNHYYCKRFLYFKRFKT